MARSVAICLLAVLGGCVSAPDTPECRCRGEVPGGVLDVECGGAQCLGDHGYRCAGPNTAVADRSVCAAPSSDAGTDAGPETDGGALVFCAEGWRACDGACRNLARDVDHCGGCDHRCADGEGCVDGACQAACTASEIRCGGACAACPSDGVASVRCDGTACVAQSCVAGRRLCGGRCAECPVGASSHGCDGDRCVPSTCEVSSLLCDGVCAPCPAVMTGQEHVCAGTTCTTTCSSGYVRCGTECVRPDAAHCGPSCETCPTDSNGTASCVAGSCRLSCATGFLMCGGACARCPSDASSLGCAGASCVAATCVTGFTPCAEGCCHVTPTGAVTGVLAGSPHDIELGPRRQPIIATSYDEVRLLWGRASGWSASVIDAGTGATAPRFEVDAAGRVHLVYLRSYTLRYVVLDGSTRTEEDVTPTALYLIRSHELALDSAGRPVVAFVGTDGDVRIATRDAAGWRFDPMGESTNTEVALALDADDRAHLAFVDLSGTLRYVRRTSSGWEGRSVLPADRSALRRFGPGAADGYWSPVGLVLDSSGRPHVLAYSRAGSSGRWDVQHARWDGTRWTYSTVASAAYEQAVVTYPYLDLMIGPTDTLHAVWVTVDPDGREVGDYARRPSAAGWSTPERFSGPTARNQVVAVDDRDSAHVAYGCSPPAPCLSRTSYLTLP